MCVFSKFFRTTFIWDRTNLELCKTVHGPRCLHETIVNSVLCKRENRTSFATVLSSFGSVVNDTTFQQDWTKLEPCKKSAYDMRLSQIWRLNRPRFDGGILEVMTKGLRSKRREAFFLHVYFR